MMRTVAHNIRAPVVSNHVSREETPMRPALSFSSRNQMPPRALPHISFWVKVFFPILVKPSLHGARSGHARDRFTLIRELADLKERNILSP